MSRIIASRIVMSRIGDARKWQSQVENKEYKAKKTVEVG